MESDIVTLWEFPGSEGALLVRTLSGPFTEKTLGLQDSDRRLHASSRLVEAVKRVFQGQGGVPKRSRSPIRERIGGWPEDPLAGLPQFTGFPFQDKTDRKSVV